ncbi:MAG: NFACT family protein, partial [Clostridia bacterium]|nr:NFACT family protein [Clostridia bacterium]
AKTISTLVDKLLLKKQRLLEDLKKAEEADIYRIKGEILNANLHLVKPGAKSVKLISFYDGQEIEIALDEKINAARNAQAYFKKYNKAKGSRKEKLPQLEATERDIAYLESLLAMVPLCKNYEELDAIRSELAEGGYVRTNKKAQRTKPAKPKPRKYLLKSGLEVVVGRNNIENDYITFKMGEKTDWWFHTKDIHGSHLVMLCHGIDPSPEDMYEAAGIAAFYSKGKDSENVPVDYCPLRHVKKPSGAKPGMVIFTNNGTVWVNPINPEQNK